MKKRQDINTLKKYVEKHISSDVFNNRFTNSIEPYKYSYEENDKLSCDISNPLIKRFSSYLLEHSKDDEYVSLNSSLQEIAHFFGTSYRNLNKTIKELESDSIINCKGKYVYILKLEALRDLSENEIK